jgi:hypothetical protein
MWLKLFYYSARNPRWQGFYYGTNNWPLRNHYLHDRNSAKIDTIVNKAVVPTTNIGKTVPVGGGTITTVDKTVTVKGGKVTRIDKTVIVEKIRPKVINVNQPTEVV